MNNCLVLLIGSIWDVLKLKIISVNLKIKYSWEFYILSGSPARNPKGHKSTVSPLVSFLVSFAWSESLQADSIV